MTQGSPQNSPNRLADPLVQFVEPAYLFDNNQRTFPHLSRMALLLLGEEVVLVLPEENPVVTELQDYTLIACGTFERYQEDPSAQQGFVDYVRGIDFLRDSDENAVPPGVLMLRTGEEALLGRSYTPQLGLGDSASELHARMLIENHGITVQNYDNFNGTSVNLSPEDADRLPRSPREAAIDDATRDSLYNTYHDLLMGKVLSRHEPDLKIDGYLTAVSPFLLGIDIDRAKQYPELDPGDGYDRRTLYVDPSERGVEVVNVPAKRRQREPGIRQARQVSQLTHAQVTELLKLAEHLRYLAG